MSSNANHISHCRPAPRGAFPKLPRISSQLPTTGWGKNWNVGPGGRLIRLQQSHPRSEPSTKRNRRPLIFEQPEMTRMPLFSSFFPVKNSASFLTTWKSTQSWKQTDKDSLRGWCQQHRKNEVTICRCSRGTKRSCECVPVQSIRLNGRSKNGTRQRTHTQKKKWFPATDIVAHCWNELLQWKVCARECVLCWEEIPAKKRPNLSVACAFHSSPGPKIEKEWTFLNCTEGKQHCSHGWKNKFGVFFLLPPPP